jgi:hypothetical protein
LLNKIVELIKWIKICPAIILIVKRKIKVRGRIKNLNNSIRIIIGISKFLVPNGKIWIKKLLFIFVNEINKIGNHKIIIIYKFILIWLVILKLKKFNLKKFINRINENIITKKKSLIIFIKINKKYFFKKYFNILIFLNKEIKIKK